MATLYQVKAEAKKLGVDVDDWKIGSGHGCDCRTPKGKIFAANFLHSICEETNRPWKPDYAHILERLEMGLEDCPDIDCEICCEEIDDD